MQYAYTRGGCTLPARVCTQAQHHGSHGGYMYTHAGSQNYQQLRRGGLSTVSRRRPPLRSSEHDGRDGQLRSRAREPRREERRPVGSGPSETTAVGRRRRSRRGPPARTRAPAFRNIAHDTHDVSPGGRGPPPAAPRVRNTQPSGRQKKHRGCCVYGGSAALACPHPALTQPRAWPSGMSLTLCASLRGRARRRGRSSRQPRGSARRPTPASPRTRYSLAPLGP